MAKSQNKPSPNLKTATKVVIPSTTSRCQPIPYNETRYRQRNPIERMFARLKGFRRIVTRYDERARNFLASARRVTPAMAAKVTDRLWSLRELGERTSI